MTTEHSKDSSGAKRIFWGCLGVVGITFVVLLLGGGIWYAAATSQARSELAKEVKLLRDRGAPLTTIDLHEQYQAEFQNPPYAPALLQALAAGTNHEMAELAKPLPIVGIGPEVPPLGQPWPQQADAEHYLAQNQKLLELLEQLSKDPVRIHFTGDLRLGFHGSLDSLQSTRYGARVLSLQFQVDLRHGRTAQAIGRIEQQIALSEAMREEPFLVGQLVRCALLGVATQDLQYLVEQVELSDAELARLQVALRRPDLLHSLRKALDSEAASIYTLSTWPRDAMVDAENLTVDEVTRLANQPPRRPADVALMLSFFRRMQQASETSLAAAQAEGKQIEAETKQLAGSNARMFYMDSISLGPTLGAVPNAFLRADARLQSADVALAALRYRRAHQEWPTSLQQMVPAFLPQVPVDPYNGKELLFQATPTEFKVYSVGQNLVDDGGTWTDGDLTDVGFVAPWRNASPTDDSQPAQPLPNEENQ